MSSDPKELRILLVEDSGLMRKMEIKTLKQLGYAKITEAEDGNVAITKLQAEDFDLIISDWNMPEKDGLELVVWVRAAHRLRALFPAHLIYIAA